MASSIVWLAGPASLSEETARRHGQTTASRPSGEDRAANSQHRPLASRDHEGTIGEPAWRRQPADSPRGCRPRRTRSHSMAQAVEEGESCLLLAFYWSLRMERFAFATIVAIGLIAALPAA